MAYEKQFYGRIIFKKRNRDAIYQLIVISKTKCQSFKRIEANSESGSNYVTYFMLAYDLLCHYMSFDDTNTFLLLMYSNHQI